MKIKTLSQVKNLKGKRVLVRMDYNVPLDKGQVKETYKIEQSLPTIKYLLKKGAKVILISHLGRPKGVDKKLSLKPVAKVLEKMLGKKVPLLANGQGFLVAPTGLARNDSDVVLLENIRFNEGEEKNDPKLAKELAALADIFVLDGFAVAHRDAASVSGVAKFLPAYAGLLLAKEVDGLSRATETPQRPFVVVIGGIKMETKLPVLKNLLPKADKILVGGGLFNTYLWAKGYGAGISAVDKNFRKETLAYLSQKKIILPVDVVVGDRFGKKFKVVDVNKKFEIGDRRYAIYDIGPKTIRLYAKYIKSAQTLIWNGAMGYFEQHPYEYGTYAIARLFAARSQGRAFGLCGGGETVEVLKKLKIMEEIDLVSTGGGAMLEFLSGKELPGVKAVSHKP